MDFIYILKCVILLEIAFLASDVVSGQKTKAGGTKAPKTTSKTTTSAATTVTAASTAASTDAVIIANTESILTTTDAPVVPSTIVLSSTLSDIASFPVDTSSQLPDDTYAVEEGGKRCIMIKMDAKFDIEYRKKDQVLKQSLALPDDLSVTGSCGSAKTLPQIVLGWKSYQLLLMFDKSSDDRSVYVTSIQMTYSPAEVFEDSKLKKSFRAKSSDEIRFMEAPTGLSFACSEPRKVTMYDDQGAAAVYAVIERIKVQAYLQDESNFEQEFGCGSKLVVASPITDDSPTYSPGQIFRSDTVPIAVGSTLAVATVLVVAAYAVYRSLTVKKMEYATFEE